MVYIAKVDSTRAVRMVSAVGRTLPALLADLTEAELAALYPRRAKLAALTERSITTVAGLSAQLREVAERGVSLEKCESNPDVCCVSAPVRDHLDRTVAAMSISVPASRWTSAERPGWGRTAPWTPPTQVGCPSPTSATSFTCRLDRHRKNLARPTTVEVQTTALRKR